MRVISWLSGHFSHHGKAMARYKRGMRKANLHDYRGAIADYNETVAMLSSPSDLKAMVLYNRALAFAAIGDGQALTDLAAVLAMEAAPVNIRTMAKQKLAKLESRSRKAKA